MRASLPAMFVVLLVGACAAAPVPTSTLGPSAAPGPSSPSPSAVQGTSDPTADPSPSPGPTTTIPPIPPPESPDPLPPHWSPTPQPGPYSVDLYRAGAFVSEVEKYMCLPAAMQVSINIMKDGPVDTTAATQWKLYNLARTFLIEPYTGTVGAQPEGWAGGLNSLGYGPYQVAVKPTLADAIHLAAKQLRSTGRPVGLLVWRGAHSWVMSGFKSDIDPAISDNFTVTGIYAEDVWYPRISTIWGPSFPPDTFDPFDQIHIDYKPYLRPHEVHPDKDGKFVLVVPTLPNQGV